MGVIIRQSIKGTMANYIGIAIGFVNTFFIITRYLTPEEVGLTRILVDAGVLYAGLAQLGTNSSAIRYYPYFKDEKAKDHGFFAWTLIIPLIGFLIYSVIFLLFKNVLNSVYSTKSALFTDYIYLLIPLAFFMLYQSVFEVNANVLMRIAVPKFVREVGVRLLTLVTYLLYAYKVFTLTQFVWAFCLVYAVAMLCDLFYLLSLKKISFKPDKKFITKSLKKDFLFYTFFMITAALAGNIMPVLNTFFVGAKMGLVYTGIFAIANYISSVIEVPYRSLGSIAQPQLSEAIGEKNFTRANKLCKSVSLHQFLAGSFIFFIIWINIDLLFKIIPNAETYEAGKWVVFILGMSRLLNSSLSIGCTVLNYSKYYYYSLLFTFLLTISAVFFNAKLISLYGIYGAAMASLFSYVIYFALLLFVVYKTIQVSPFSIQHLKVILIILFVFAVNILYIQLIKPYILSENISMTVELIEALLRTILLMASAIALVYSCKVSKEVNSLIDKCILFKFKK